MIDIESQAIALVRSERLQWEDATAFVTEKVAFQMRNLIRQFRKNYWGIFNSPIDPTTQRDQIWIPLTESVVEAAIKNFKIETKDIGFRAKKAESQGMSSLMRSIVKNKLDEIYFGTYLDQLARNLAIDGTVVWKTVDEYDPILQKRTMRILPVDLLNIYIDPTAPTIQKAQRFTERSLQNPQDVKAMEGWINTEDIEGSVGLNRTDATFRNFYGSTGGYNTRMVDVWELWGQIPKSLMTGNPSDDKKMIEGHIIVSGLDGDKNKGRVHLIEENAKGIRPYEEARYTNVNGRWYGRGLAEKMLMLQLWLNTIVNIRINRSYISQLGIFKIKRGKGITPSMISRLSANGAIIVQDQDDIEQMVMQEASAASFEDEKDIYSWAERVTQVFSAVTGEQMPHGKQNATTTAIISRNAQATFSMVKENAGIFLQKWLKRHAIPILMKNVKAGDVLRHTGETEEVRAYDESIVNNAVYQELNRIHSQGGFVDPQQVELERQRLLLQLSQQGKERFVHLEKKVDHTEFEVQVYVTNEEIDKGILVQNLMQLLQVIPAIPQAGIDPSAVLRQVLDTMGLDSGQYKLAPQMNQTNPQQGVPAPQGFPTQNPLTQITGANTANAMGIR